MIGRVLIAELEQAGHELRLMDVNDPDKATVFVPGPPGRQLAPIQTHWPVVKGSILDVAAVAEAEDGICLLYTSPSPRDATLSRMPSSA